MPLCRHPGLPRDGERLPAIQPDAADAVSLAEKVACLGRGQCLDTGGERVEVVETRMSWVFMAGDAVFKLKKPLREPLIDLRTVEQRRINCAREVRLNRRLAPGVYFGIVPLTLEPGRRLGIGGTGRVVDWLVHMRRLARESMLEFELSQGSCRRAPTERAAGVLADFYLNARREHLHPAAHFHRIARETERRVRHLQSWPLSFHPATLRQLLVDQRRWLERRRPLLERRAAERRIVEGHGDLRPQHVCLTPRPLFIDCLEFSRSLRILDPLDDLAYLALECERLGAAWVGECFVDVYAARAEDGDAAPLVPFYAGRRAVLRACQCLRHLPGSDEAQGRTWRQRADRYLELAVALTARAAAAT